MNFLESRTGLSDPTAGRVKFFHGKNGKIALSGGVNFFMGNGKIGFSGGELFAG